MEALTREHTTPDRIRTVVHRDANGVITIRRQGIVQTVREWDNSPMLNNMSMNEVDAILTIAIELGYQPD